MKAVESHPTWFSASNHDVLKAPAWLTNFRLARWQAFQQMGLPVKQDERWKYTDLSMLKQHNFHAAEKKTPSDLIKHIQQHRLLHGEAITLVMVNGQFAPTLSDLNQLPAEVTICSLSQALVEQPDAVEAPLTRIEPHNHVFANLNAASFNDGLFIHVLENYKLTQPVHLLLIAENNGFIAHPRHIIQLEKNSQLTLIEEYVAITTQPYMTNTVMTVDLKEQAQFEYYKIQNENKQAVHMANTFLFQESDSQASLAHFSAGGQFARDEIRVELQAPGAHCKTAGFYGLTEKDQYVDYHIDMLHTAPLTRSEMVYKGVLDNKSRAVFNGRVYVEKEAKKIEAHQANHNLLLSNMAEVYSKPELEIYSDDVKCKHGATIGQLDQEALFYLRSRGLNKAEATTLLLKSFSDDIMQRVASPAIRAHIEKGLKWNEVGNDDQ